MASLTRQKGKYYRVFWKFKVSAGPKTGQTIEGSVYLGRCTRATAKARLREIESWEEAVKAGRHLPDGGWEEVYHLWLREKELSCTPQSVQRAQRVVTRYVAWRKQHHLQCKYVDHIGCRQDLIRWRDYRLDHEAGRKTVANDLAYALVLVRVVRRRAIPHREPDPSHHTSTIRYEEGRDTAHKATGRSLAVGHQGTHNPHRMRTSFVGGGAA